MSSGVFGEILCLLILHGLKEKVILLCVRQVSLLLNDMAEEAPEFWLHERISFERWEIYAEFAPVLGSVVAALASIMVQERTVWEQVEYDCPLLVDAD